MRLVALTCVILAAGCFYNYEKLHGPDAGDPLGTAGTGGAAAGADGRGGTTGEGGGTAGTGGAIGTGGVAGGTAGGGGIAGDAGTTGTAGTVGGRGGAGGTGTSGTGGTVGGRGGAGGTSGTAGTGGGTGPRFNGPSDVAVDGAGNVFVADTNNNTIRKVTATGVVTTLAGKAGTQGSTDGTGAAARFSQPHGVAVDGAGNVFVTDGSAIIRKVTPAGVVTTLAGTPGTQGSADGTGAAARFNQPRGVAVDSAGSLYVADSANSIIRKITAAGVVTTFAGTALMGGSTDGTGGAARFYFPYGVAVDGAGNVYVADTNNYTIRKITAAGVVTTLAGTAAMSGSADGTGGAARFYIPSGVAVDGAGNLYIGDTNNHIIRKVTAAGVVTTLAGTAMMMGSANGTGAAARFYFPYGVAVDGAGNVYVGDTVNQIIRKVTAAGVVTTLAGSVMMSGSADM